MTISTRRSGFNNTPNSPEVVFVDFSLVSVLESVFAREAVFVDFSLVSVLVLESVFVYVSVYVAS